MSARTSAPFLTIPRACLATALYQLAWGLVMLLRGAEFLRPGLGDYPGLADPLSSTWIRLVGTTLVGMTFLGVALSRVRDVAAQRFIRLGWLAFWLNEIVVDGLLLQLPAYLAGAKHLVLVGIVVTFAGRSLMALLWVFAKPLAPAPEAPPVAASP